MSGGHSGSSRRLLVSDVTLWEDARGRRNLGDTWRNDGDERRRSMSRRVVVSTIGAVALAALVLVGGASAAKAPRVRSASSKMLVHTRFLDVTGLAAAGSQAPTDAFCREHLGVPCYSPQEIRHAYGVDALVSRGDQGKGQTIVIIDSFGSPTITSDLQAFDAGYGLPDPPSFKVLSPLGTV